MIITNECIQFHEIIPFVFVIAAACMASCEGFTVGLELLLPWASTDEDVVQMISRFDVISHELFALHGTRVPFRVGCMLAVPRACMEFKTSKEDQIVDFITINCDVLTEMVYGISKAEFCFVSQTGHNKTRNPFEKIDFKGVGSLIKTAILRSHHASASTKVFIVT